MKLFRNLSIKYKIIVIILFVTVLILVMGFSFDILRNIKTLKQNLLDSTFLNAKLTGANCIPPLVFQDQTGAEEVLSTLQSLDNLLYAGVWDATGKQFASFSRFTPDAIPPVPENLPYFEFTGNRLHLFQPLLYRDKNYGIIYFQLSTEELNAKIRIYLLQSILFTVILILFAYLITLKLQRVITKPILDLAEITGKISSENNYSIRVQKPSSDEIGFLYDKFNDLLEQINTQNIKRDEAEKALRESEHKYRQLIEGSNDAIYLLYDNKFEIVNRKFCDMFGVTLEEVNRPDFNFIDLVASKSRPLIRERERRLANGENIDPKYEFTAITRDGKEVIVEVSVSYITYKDGIATQGILRDLTERKKLEQQLVQSQKMEAIGKLAGGVAHDFNNILTVILGYCELANMAISKDHPVYEYFHQIEIAGKKAASLTNQLLAFSRRQFIKLSIVNINSVITDMQKMLHRVIGEDIEIQITLEQDIKLIKADPAQIEQIIMNLSVNARDAMPNGGLLTFETKNVALDGEYAKEHSGVKPGSYVLISVSDTGIGMGKEIRDQIFEPFFTTKEKGKGTGLGLSTVYGIVKQNDGFIYVYSEPNVGTTFKIYFPCTNEEISEPETNPDDVISDLSGNETILVAEDEKSVRKFAVSSLKKYGYNVLEAGNGHEALQYFPKNNSSNIHLLITDVIMPNMNGRELANKVLDIDPKIKVLFMSGYTDDMVLRHGISSTELAFIQKPFSTADLLKKVRKVLDSQNKNL
ncbi:MAG TPA: hypothetical protein DHW42_11640 [Candidatus Marinimicrobia bacterium]|nr:hypothetical protein [Candidatus Neomarinimicrobiota bacterium]